jgi:hypothetical protein
MSERPVGRTLKLFIGLGSSFLLLAFSVAVVSQTAQLVLLAREVSPTLGTVTLWGLLTAYGTFLGVPFVMILRMPRALVPPKTADGPEFDNHLRELGVRLAANPWIRRAGIDTSTRRGIEESLDLLDLEAQQIIRQMASTVFLSTAVSQSGRLDAFLVLGAQSRMVWRIAHLYYQRPSLREMVHLYTNVTATAFVAGELDDLQLHEMIQPMVAGSVGAFGAAIPGFQVLSTMLVTSLLSGSTNAFLTLRIGLISQSYCHSLVAHPRADIRKSATGEAARMLSGIVKNCGSRVRDAMWDEFKSKIARPWPGRKPQPETV